MGNLVEVKRVDKLPEIYNNIKKLTSDDLMFLIVGDGDLRKQIEQNFTEMNANVLFTGKVPPHEIISYLGIMDVLILPSRQEGLGSVLLESQACGIPVIGSSNGGIPEAIIDKNNIIKDNEFFERKIAEKIVSILNNKYSVNLLNSLIDKFDWDKNSSKELQIYSEVLKVD
ncbi:glycosyltransferase family 4 protein [Bacillus sp. OVS6]|nr:glycosyltransferase family 4 protein [Bacillus sp. OVS6]